MERPAHEGGRVLTERLGHVLLITLNRPEVHNVVDRAMASEIGAALEEADADREIRAIVLTGAGDHTFCAGSDLRAFERAGPADPSAPEWGFAGVAEHPISTPIIAAVNGLCLGGGTELVLTADLAIAGESATFGMPEVKVGVTFTGARRMARALPRKVAMDLLLTGRLMDAERALAHGLVNEVVPSTQVLTAALELADLVSTRAPLAVQANKRLALGIEHSRVIEDEEALAHGRREAKQLLATRDAAEGVRSFLEKRQPVWQSR